MSFLSTIQDKLRQVKSQLSEKYHVNSIGLFGSIVRTDFKPESHIDIVVDFSQPIGIEFVDLADELEKLLERKVDLVSKAGIRPQYYRAIESDILPRMLIPTLVTSTPELEQIAALSDQNLSANVPPDKKASQGFVTWAYTLPVLQQLHELAPSVIVKDDDFVAGYALVLPVEAVEVYPPLQELMGYFSQLNYKGKPVLDYRFYVMGQVCVAEKYRGQGVFDMLYAHHRRLFKGRYDFVITEIATRNQRSRRAHERVGFEPIHTYRDQVDEWDVVVLDLR